MQPENQSFIEKNKKELIIIGVITLIFLIVVGILFYFKNKNGSTGSTGGSLPNKGDSVSLYSKNINQNNGSNSQDGETGDNNTNYYSESLIKIWDRPVAGYGFYNDDGNNILIFVDATTGFLYQKNLNNPTSTPDQLTSTPYPNTRNAYFLNINNQKKIIIQYTTNNVVKTVLANIPYYYSVAGNLEKITTLDDNINNIAISDDFNKAVYVVNKSKTILGKKDLYSNWYTIDNRGINKIYSSEISSWKLQITNLGDVYAYNDDTATEKSALYKLNNSLKRLYDGHTGSSYLINNNSILSSAFTSSGLKIYLNKNFNGDNFTDGNLLDLNFKTLSNKCYLGDFTICAVPKEIKNYDTGLPDAWYQGLTSWQDNLYIVSSNYPSPQLLFNLNLDGGVGDSFDIKNIQIVKNKSHVLFINKNDGSLWSLNIQNILNLGD